MVMQDRPRITPIQLEKFSKLLEQSYEGPCQKFLGAHDDILLSVFGGRVCFPKFRLGAEFETDFALLGSDSSGLLVILIELEPPSCAPFNRDGTFSKRLNQAMNQVHDWMAWIEKNKSYFCNRVVDAIKVEGGRFASVGEEVVVEAKIVIGRREHLTQKSNAKRQSIYRTSQRTIEITNYDRLLEGGARLCAASLRSQELPQRLGRLGRSGFAEIRLAVANSQSVSQDTLKYLSKDPDPGVRAAVAVNASTSPQILEALSLDSEEFVRAGVARNNHSTEGTLTILFQDSEGRVRDEVVRNVRCPTPVLRAAGRHEDGLLRRIAAENPRLDSDTQNILSDDRDDDVRRVLARNLSLDETIAIKMLGDADKLVRLGIYRKQNLPEALLVANIWQEPSWIRAEIARSPNLRNVEVLSSLARDSAAVVRLGVADNSNLEEAVANSMLLDSDQRVRAAIEKRRTHPRNSSGEPASPPRV